MREQRLRCYIGNLDGQRDGMVFAPNQRTAAAVVKCSIYHFSEYWVQQPNRPISDPKPLTLYTRNDYRSEWQEGICQLPGRRPNDRHA